MRRTRVLKKGEVIYLGYRPEMSACVYAVRPIDGMPPNPLGRMLSATHQLFRTLQEELEALDVWLGCNDLPEDVREGIWISIDKIKASMRAAVDPEAVNMHTPKRLC